jgi:endonuclease G, mitochondrial
VNSLSVSTIEQAVPSEESSQIEPTASLLKSFYLSEWFDLSFKHLTSYIMGFFEWLEKVNDNALAQGDNEKGNEVEVNREALSFAGQERIASSTAIYKNTKTQQKPPKAGAYCLGEGSQFVQQSGEGYGKYGYPTIKTQDPSNTWYLCRTGYAVNYNCETKQPNYVVYSLNQAKVSQPHGKRHAAFQADQTVDENCQAHRSDYKHSGYDRGHAAPYAAMAFSYLSAKQSFLLTNMSPQKGALNRQGWAQLETNVRKWAKNKDYGRLFVYTGPIFDEKNTKKTVGDDHVRVPDAYFKIIFAPDSKKPNKLLAFKMPNKKVTRKDINVRGQDENGNFKNPYLTTVDNIEELTGYDFFTENVDIDIEKMEQNKSDVWQ